MFTRHVTVSVFEDQNGCFVDLEGEVGLGGSQRVVDVGLGVRQEKVEDNGVEHDC